MRQKGERVRALAGLLIIVFGLTYTAVVRANGPIPASAADRRACRAIRSTVYLRATLASAVEGRREDVALDPKALGYEGQWDPSIAVTRDGRL